MELRLYEENYKASETNTSTIPVFVCNRPTNYLSSSSMLTYVPRVFVDIYKAVHKLHIHVGKEVNTRMIHCSLANLLIMKGELTYSTK